MDFPSNVEYKKKYTTLITMRMFHSTDADIMNHLDSKKNRTGYIKSLIRKDIAESIIKEEAEKPQ